MITRDAQTRFYTLSPGAVDNSVRNPAHAPHSNWFINTLRFVSIL